MSAVDASSAPHVNFGEWMVVEDALVDVRHELIEGRLELMTGGTVRHAAMIGALTRLLFDSSLDHGCRVLTADAKLRVDDDNGFYPDVMVACDDFADDRFEDSPCLVAEVLSPSTRSRDLTVKLRRYMTIDTLRTCLFVDPIERDVTVYRRTDSGWHADVADGGSVDLDCPPMTLDIDELYRMMPSPRI